MTQILKKQIEDLQQQAEELQEVREDLFNAKADLTVAAMIKLLEKLDDTIDEFVGSFKDNEKKESGLDKIAGEIKTSLSETVKALFENQKPIEFKPAINMDLKPILLIAGEIAKQNKGIADLMGKLMLTEKKDDPEYKGVMKSIESMIAVNNDLVKGLKQFDYTYLDKLTSAVAEKQSEWVATVSGRDPIGRIETIKIKAVKTTK